MMASRKTLIFLAAVLAAVSPFLIPIAPLFAANREKLLFSFHGTDGDAPYAGLVSDAAGNLYGTTYSGGAYGYGTVFQLVLGTNGTWTETVLHSFDFGNDGVLPCARLTFDTAGNLYGTTRAGGAYGYGSVFQLAPDANGTWTETVLHSFDDGDGYAPYAGLTFDGGGNLYGTTLYGGAYGYGTVFQMAPGANGAWTETVLYSFSGNSADGAYPYSGVLFDPAGALHGTTYAGGAYGYGTVFQLTPGKNGAWTEKVLHSFGNSESKDGMNPYDNLVLDKTGALYGTTYSGGAHNYGTIFQLVRSAKGRWKERVLHSFDKNRDGAYPSGDLIPDSADNLYGTTYSGGGYGYGTVFQFSLGTNGKWIEKVLSSFDWNDGNGPYDGLIFGAGNLYGTTEYGGSGCGGLGCGTVFEIRR